jgi:hypothetical protein
MPKLKLNYKRKYFSTLQKIVFKCRLKGKGKNAQGSSNK